MAKAKKQRSATSADVAFGTRIRARRIEARMSQAELGDKLGVSFQQIQKYEKGTNRVSASRLGEIAKVLNESPAYFTGADDTPTTSKFMALLNDKPSQRLLLAFSKIASTAMRYQIVGMVEKISGEAAA